METFFAWLQQDIETATARLVGGGGRLPPPPARYFYLNGRQALISQNRID